MLPTFTPEHASMQPALVAPLREGLHEWLEQGWIDAGLGDFPGDGWDACPVEAFDLTHKAALHGAKTLKQSPRAVAQAWVAALGEHPFVEAVAIVGPGHVNLKLHPGALLQLLGEEGPFQPTPAQPATLVEFVSANPTGPLHLGHARQAVLGSTLVHLLRQHGWLVGAEFYSNDSGAQIDMLVRSVQLRMQEQTGAPLLFERDLDANDHYDWTAHAQSSHWAPATALATGNQIKTAYPEAVWFPRDGYHGQDIVHLARSALGAGLDRQDDEAIKQHAVAHISAAQQSTLATLGVHFDSFASERGLHDSGDVGRVVEGLRHFAYRGLSAHQDPEPPKAGAQPAWFLRTTIHGDDKDRVMQKHDGSVPYFIPDVAYHIDKYRRGWTRAVNIQGSDHHGTLARLRAGMLFLGGPAEYPQAIFHTMVSVLKDGKPLVASKRAGTALPADQIIEWLGVDAFRMSLLSQGPGSELTVDIDAWQSQGLSNPVYAIQYASARLHSMLDKARAAELGDRHEPEFTAQQHALAKALLVQRDKLQRAALAMEPTRVAQFAKEIASLVHSAYEHSPKLVELNEPSRRVHAALFQAALTELKNCCQTLGVNAPERMDSLSQKTAPSSLSGGARRG